MNWDLPELLASLKADLIEKGLRPAKAVFPTPGARLKADLIERGLRRIFAVGPKLRTV